MILTMLIGLIMENKFLYWGLLNRVHIKINNKFFRLCRRYGRRTSDNYNKELDKCYWWIIIVLKKVLNDAGTISHSKAIDNQKMNMKNLE